MENAASMVCQRLGYGPGTRLWYGEHDHGDADESLPIWIDAVSSITANIMANMYCSQI